MHAARARRATVWIISVILALVAPAPVSAGAEYAAERVALAKAIRSRLMTSSGGVLSYYRNALQEDPAEAGAGHDRTSEATGLLLAYAAGARDASLFRLARGYYTTFMRSAEMLAYWKLDRLDRPWPNEDGSFSSAPIDELRIARALLAGRTAFGDSTLTVNVKAQGRALLGGVFRGLLSDDVSWGPWEPSPGELVSVQYLDVYTMRRLAAWEPAWDPVATRSLGVLQRAGSMRPPRQVYDPVARVYRCDGFCETTPGLWSALHLLDAGDRARAQGILEYYRARYRSTLRLFDAYSTTHRGSGDEELAAYALFARLAWRLGDRTTARDVLARRIMPARIRTGTLAGLFTFVRYDAPGFDNLQILLTLQEIAGVRARAD